MNRRRFVQYGAGAMGLSLLARTGRGSQEEERTSARGGTLRIKLCSIIVDDQDKALAFYTNVLGFVKKQDIPVGKFRWLTVVSPHEPEGTELSLEPNENPAAKTFQRALHEQGIPLTAFAVEDVVVEFERLEASGVRFHTRPTSMGSAKVAVLDDTCGNLIQLYQVVGPAR